MATGSGKTFTAISAIYRLIKYAKAERVLFLVDRANLGRQTFTEFQQYVAPDDQPQVHRALQRPAPALELHRPDGQGLHLARSSGSTRSWPAIPSWTSRSRRARCSIPSSASPHRSRLPTTRPPDRDLRRHLHRRMPPLDLQPLAPGARILRRLPDRPDRHAEQAGVRLLQPEPGHGVHPRAGRDRRVNVPFDVYPIRTRITEQGSTVEAGYQVDYRDKPTRETRWERARRGPDLHRPAARPRRGRDGPDPDRRPHLPRQALHRDLPRPDRGAEDADLRQGRHPRRRHRPDRARGVRQGQRLLPEDHLPHHRRSSRRSCSPSSATTTTRASWSRST